MLRSLLCFSLFRLAHLSSTSTSCNQRPLSLGFMPGWDQSATMMYPPRQIYRLGNLEYVLENQKFLEFSSSCYCQQCIAGRVCWREFRAGAQAARTIRYWLFGEAFGRSFRDCFLPGLLFSITPPTDSVRSVSLTQNSSPLASINTLANCAVDSSTTTAPAVLWLCVACRLFFITQISRCVKKTQ